MIKAIHLGKEIAIISPNRVGVLARVSKVLAERGINITAVSAQAAGGVALVNLVVDDHGHAMELLKKKGLPVQENSVVVMELTDKPGALRFVSERLAAKKVDLFNIYGSTTEDAPCLLVLTSSDNHKAFAALKKK